MRLERELDEMGEETLTTKARKVLRKYDLPTAALDWGESNDQAHSAKAVLKLINEQQLKQLRSIWDGKKVHGRYRKACKAEGTSREDTNRWLMEGAETVDHSRSPGWSHQNKMV